MSKKNISKQKSVKESGLSKFSLEKYMPEKYQTAILFGVILIIFLAFYSPLYFGGETFQSGDIVTSMSHNSYLEKDRDGFTLWNPYIFLGMPAYALATEMKWFNFIHVGIYSARAVFSSFFSTDYAKWTFYLILLAFSSFALTMHFTKNKLLSLFSGLATSFSTGLALFLFIGHVTKLTALAFYPLIFLMLLRFQKQIKLRDFALLIIILQLSMQGWHVQIIFYTLLSVAIFFIYTIVHALIGKRNKEAVHQIKSGFVFVGAFLIAIIIQSDNLTQIYEWNPYSTRGTESIVDIQSGAQKGHSDSDFYQYATNWSFSPGEIMTFIVPSYYGFGGSTYNGPLTQNKDVEVNTYFGQMPFVDYPMYMGVAIFFLALFSMYANRKNQFVQFLTVLTLISLLISFGRTFPLFYNLMFYYFPFFDKFRVPSMILVLMQLSLPLLAAMGIHRIIELKKEGNKQLENILKYTTYVFSGIFVLSIILNSAVTNWFTGRVNDHAAALQASGSQMAQQFKALAGYMGDMFATDFMIAFLVLAVSFWMIQFYLNKKVSKDILIIVITIFTLFDLFRIDSRGLKYSPEGNVDQMFAEPEYAKIIKSQNDTQPFRMLNIKQDRTLGSFGQNSNFNMYLLLEDFYGYSSIKPRAYQDLLDVVGPVNPTLWDMMNVKYIVTGQQAPMPGLKLLKNTKDTYVYENENVLPRIYFADSALTEGAFKYLSEIKTGNVDPKAFTLLDNETKIDKPDSTASIKIEEYKDEYISVSANASGNNLMVVSNTYYPVGWKVYIDGNETELLRVNHAVQGIMVPKGNHKIEFIYNPESFVISKYLSLFFSSLTILVFVLSFVWTKKKKSA